MPRFEKGTENAKTAMEKCRDAKKRLKKGTDASTICFGGGVNEIQNEVKKEIETIKKEPKKKSIKKKVEPVQPENVKISQSNQPNTPTPDGSMKELIYEIQQQILDVAKDVDYLLMKE